MHGGLTKSRFVECPECSRAAAFDVLRQVCTVISCDLYPKQLRDE